MSNWKIRNKIFFIHKKSQLNERIEKDFIDKGYAVLPCKVNEYNDIINRFSVTGYESLNPEFKDYVVNFAQFIPPEYPIIINISDCRFTKEEKEVIKKTIREEFLYDLGIVEEENKGSWKKLLAMLVGTLLSGVLIGTILNLLDDISSEFVFIIFWFFGYSFMEYISIELPDGRKNKIFAGRLASAGVFFEDEYSEEDYTEAELKKISESVFKNDDF